jgi:hypothetical protein
MRLAFRSRLSVRRPARLNLDSITPVKTAHRSAADNTTTIDTRGCMR